MTILFVVLAVFIISGYVAVWAVRDEAWKDAIETQHQKTVDDYKYMRDRSEGLIRYKEKTDRLEKQMERVADWILEWEKKKK